ncbi:hypothetical protein DXG01_009286 [Tephrocybe rancida]|nr:hypothetical protein DXG01_009286 [Tephrocybe rancida]
MEVPPAYHNKDDLTATILDDAPEYPVEKGPSTSDKGDVKAAEDEAPAYRMENGPSTSDRDNLNAAEEQAPDYPVENGPPPSYDFPQTFAIGAGRTKAPLITSNQVKNHLGLLYAFATLKTRVEGINAERNEEIPFLPQDPERRWAWFVALAVERFSVWCQSLKKEDSGRRATDVLPPVDVLMVWHAYMLNPGWYHEDCTRISQLRGLKYLTTIFADSFSSELEEILTSEPTKARLDFWTTNTGRPFDPIRDAELYNTRQVFCPKCRRALPAAYMNAEGTGFFQEKFELQCPEPGCKDVPKITRQVLGARKLAEDLARTAVEDDVSPPCLAGTIRTPQNSADVARGKLVRDTVLKAAVLAMPSGGTEEWIVAILQRSKYDLNVIRASMAGKMRSGGGNLITRIMSAYQSGYIFSVELAGAVIRQGSFVKKMHDLQWTQPQFFDDKEDEVALQHSIARYHAFLDLMSASPVSFYVPTLDIDLAWHTHQLLWLTYHTDCVNYIGRYIDHDDKVEEQTLSSAFDLTCRAWKDRFNMPYTHCGCPLPGTTIGQRISRLVHNYGAQKSYLVPPAREDLLAATHPSDHNAVFVWHRKHSSENLQQRRRAKFKKRQEREARERAKGKAPELTPEERRRRDAHDVAFLVPVPLYYGYAGCAAYAGAVVYSANGYGIGGCAVVRFSYTPVEPFSLRLI